MRTRTHPCYRSAAWKRVRLIILNRDAWLCQVRLPGCTTRATTADHIVGLADGGAWYELTNLRAACRPCNSALAAHRTNGHRQPTPSRRW
jgi:5-methylcytosine-specific restriction endonuclease McrA